VTPLCKENVTHKTLEKNLRRAASLDQVWKLNCYFLSTVWLWWEVTWANPTTSIYNAAGSLARLEKNIVLLKTV
jgi:hypothetical protein